MTPRVLIAAALLSGVAAMSACSTVQGTATGVSTTAPRTTTTTTTAAADVPTNIPTELAPVPKRPTALPATASCEYRAGGQAAKEVDLPPTEDIATSGTVVATIKLSTGDVTATLDRALAPCTVNSFISLADQGFYADSPCHRLTTSDTLQVLQCGDPTGTGSGGPGYSFDDEVFPEIKYGRGLLAMANAGPGPDGKGTNGSQFFIVYGACEIPPSYTVFGSIDGAGMAVIDEIAKAGTISQSMPGDGAPKTEVAITGVEIA